MKTKTKTCRRCQIDLPLDDFDLSGASSDGFRSRCKTCHEKDKKDREGGGSVLVTGTRMRTCTKCNEAKPLSDYNFTKGVRRKICSPCMSAVAIAGAHKRHGTPLPPPISVGLAKAEPADEKPSRGRVCKVCAKKKTVSEFSTWRGHRRKTCRDCMRSIGSAARTGLTYGAPENQKQSAKIARVNTVLRQVHREEAEAELVDLRTAGIMNPDIVRLAETMKSGRIAKLTIDVAAGVVEVSREQ